MRLVFRKSGIEIKQSIQSRVNGLQSRLENRNQALDDFLQNPKKVRSYLIRSTMPTSGHYQRPYFLYSKDDISSEEMEEIAQLCRRIFEIEQEIRKLELISDHLNDSEIMELEVEDLISYGFDQPAT